MKNKNILIFGAGSDIAKLLIKMLEKDNNLYKVSSNKDLVTFSNDERWFYSTYEDFNTIDQVLNNFKLIDMVIIFNGRLNSSKISKIEKNKELNDINFLYPVAIISKILDKYNKSKLHIATVTSVAGERGRYKNIIYSSSKAALTSYLSSIRQKYSMHTITTIKLGMVKTKMTNHLKLSKYLTDTPEKAAALIFKGLKSNKEIIISLKWWFVMLIVKLLPEAIFKRIKF